MSEEIDSSTDPANDKQETDPEHVVPTIRIRPVAEINTSEVSGSEAAPDTAPKRKNPSWLNAPADEDTTAKKPKTNESVDTNCDSSDAAQPSTSAISSSPKSTEKVDTGEQSSTAACDQAQPSTSASSSSLKSPEKVDTGEQSSAAACDQVDVKTEIKDEPEEDEKPSESNNPQPAQQLATVKKEEVTSSIRDSCQFGIRCYRRNATHKSDMAHPGDQDYRRPDFPLPPLGTPDCPYGDRCYRRNPIHFQQFAHPPSTDPEENYRQMKLRKRQMKKEKDEKYSDEEEDDADFIDDAESDEYIPSDTENNDTEEFLN